MNFHYYSETHTVSRKVDKRALVEDVSEMPTNQADVSVDSNANTSSDALPAYLSENWTLRFRLKTVGMI